MKTGLGTACAALALAIGACGGTSHREPRLGGAGTSKRVTTVVAALGDSITAGSPRWDPDPAVRDQMGASADPRSQYEYWARRRLPHTRFRNCGVFGERTDEIAARLDSCARGARVLILQGGINDIAQGRSVQAAARNLTETARRARSRGLRVVLVEVLPWNNGPRGADRSIRALNRRIHATGSTLHVPVYRWYSRLEDPASPGRMRANWTIDGDHPSVKGYRRLADLVRLPSR